MSLQFNMLGHYIKAYGGKQWYRNDTDCRLEFDGLHERAYSFVQDASHSLFFEFNRLRSNGRKVPRIAMLPDHQCRFDKKQDRIESLYWCDLLGDSNNEIGDRFILQIFTDIQFGTKKYPSNEFNKPDRHEPYLYIRYTMKYGFHVQGMENPESVIHFEGRPENFPQSLGREQMDFLVSFLFKEEKP